MTKPSVHSGIKRVHLAIDGGGHLCMAPTRVNKFGAERYPEIDLETREHYYAANFTDCGFY